MPDSLPDRLLGPVSGDDRITYESVTIHFRDEDRDPLVVTRVIDLVESCFPGSGERALQVIDDPRKRFPQDLLEVTLILIRPEEIDYLVLEERDEQTVQSVDEVIG